MHARYTLATLLVIQLFGVPAAIADFEHDSFAEHGIDLCRWNPVEPGFHIDPMRIAQEDGMLTVRGSGSAAACVLVPKLDWNDSFFSSVQLMIEHIECASDDASAMVGVGFGFGEFDPSVGFIDGLQLEARSTQSSVSVQLVVHDRGSVEHASAPVSVDAGFHCFEFDWRSDPCSETVSVRVYMDGDFTAPIANYEGLPRSFASREAVPMSLALFGSATEGAFLCARFDEFDFEGDFRLPTEQDDAAWADFDPHCDGPTVAPPDRAQSLASFQLAVRLIGERYALEDTTLIPLAVSARSGVIRVTAREPEGRVRDHCYVVKDGILESAEPRPATKSESAAWVLATSFEQTLPLQSLITSCLLVDPDARWLDARLDAGAAQWRVRASRDAGDVSQVLFPANGCTHGDGIASTSLPRWILGASTALAESPDVVLLSSRMTRGRCQFVVMPWARSSMVNIVEFDLMKHTILSTRARRATQDEIAASEDVDAIRTGPRWLRAMREMSERRIVALSFVREKGTTVLKLLHDDADAGLQTMDF